MYGNCFSWISKKNSVEVSYSTLCRTLHRWDLRRIQPRPLSPKADPAKKEAFREQVRLLKKRENPVFWFEDESAFWVDPGVYKVWALKGTKPTCPRSGSHYHANVMGVVRPEDGFCYAVQVSRGNRSTFQLFLDLLQPNIIEKRP
ncbi:winged helix-turn-helix domain-containing protein, partial [bacterium]|nr:winged helix-turn-helix domain-containing protein [bacterium]